jgi:predicted nucleotidyltransferase
MNELTLQPPIPDLALILPMVRIAGFCRDWQIQELYVFGSILRDDFSEGSDIDFVYKLLPNASWSFRDLLSAEQALSVIVGRAVDLVSCNSIERDRNWLRRESILGSMKLVYVTQ